MDPIRTTASACTLGGLALLVLMAPDPVSAQGSGGAPNARHPGSAVVTVGQDEYTIRIECRVAGSPEAGFTTEPNRVTREETGGRGNGVTLRLRPWMETSDIIVSLENYVAWMPRPTSAGGILALEVDLSPGSIAQGGVPVALTYDRWQAGERPEGLSGVRFVADCNQRDPAAPSYRKLPGA